MTSETLIGVYRESVFSPGKVQDDAAILNAALSALSQTASQPFRAMTVKALKQQAIRPAIILSMAQSEPALTLLENWQHKGSRVINTALSVRNCFRKPLIDLLQTASLPLPYSQIGELDRTPEIADFNLYDAYWIKRGDVHAMQSGDVVKVTSFEEIRACQEHYRRHHIKEILVQAHVNGMVIKFYAVAGDCFFQAFSDSGAAVCPSVIQRLKKITAQAAKAVGLEIYGGDVVVTPDDRIILIDLNDWPSFGRCRQSAANGISHYINAKIGKKSTF